MNLQPFMRQKASEKGIKTCPNCGVEDIFFALNGKCLECNKPIPRNSKEKTLQFSMEVFVEFFEKYDELFPKEQKKSPIQFVKELITTLVAKGSLANEKIIILQSMVKTIGQIGGNNIGGAIVVESGKPTLQLLKNYSALDADPMARIKSFSAVILSIQYILEYEVKNEFVIETEKVSSTSRHSSERKPSSANKGCLGSIVLVMLFVSILGSIIEIVL